MNTEELVRTLSSDLRPVQRLRGASVRALLWAGLALGFVALGAAAVGLRPDLSYKAHDPAFWSRGLLLLGIFILAARSTFQLGVPGGEASFAVRWLPLGAVLAWVALVSAGGLGSASTGWLCIVRMSLFVAAPAGVAFAMLRQGAPLSPGWTGGLALLAAASLAMLGTQLVCPKDAPGHALLWHLLPALIAALIGNSLGRRLLTQSFDR